MASERVFFNNRNNIRLAGIIDWPAEAPLAFALFSHCFTCTKDLKAIVKISRSMARSGIAVLRFDFTGLGESGGNFSDTNFETNVADILAAADWLQQNHSAPKFLLGLSLGGAAMMASASQIDSAIGIVTLAAPACTKHLAEFLDSENSEIAKTGAGDVSIGGRKYEISQQLLTSLRERDLESEIQSIHQYHLILHSPQDETLGFYQAERIFELTGGIKSFVSLDGADHLLVKHPHDVEFVATQIELWSRRCLAAYEQQM